MILEPRDKNAHKFGLIANTCRGCVAHLQITSIQLLMTNGVLYIHLELILVKI